MSHVKRRKQFVDRAVQGALARRLAYHWFSFLAVSTVLSIGLRVLTDPFQPFTTHLTAFVQQHACFLFLMICMTPIYLWDTVKLSNRFVGPIMRVHRALRDLNKGQVVQNVKFRRGDFWSELADEFNCLLGREHVVRPVGTDEPGREVCEPATAEPVEV